MKVLYTSSDVHDAIKRVLGTSRKGDRRVAIVAYVAANAEAYLPNADGLQLVCALEPGSTSAQALERLKRRGATIRQSSRLHMKVYWSRANGCVICSANASDNALGRNGLKEAGVWMKPGSVDIDTLLRYARPSLIRRTDLRKLAIANDVLDARRSMKGRKREPLPSFGEWAASEGRKPWKLGYWWDEGFRDSKKAKEESKRLYDVREPHDGIDGKRGQYQRYDWLLRFHIRDNVATRFDWMYVDFVSKVSRSDVRSYDPKYPYQAIQVHRKSQYPNSPFEIDARFRRAFGVALKEYGFAPILRRRSLRPPQRLLHLILQAWR